MAQDHVARLWELFRGRCSTAMAGHKDAITGVAFAPNGCSIATCSLDSTLRLWDLGTGQPACHGLLLIAVILYFATHLNCAPGTEAVAVR